MPGVGRLSFSLMIAAPDWHQAERWGDLHFARAVASALGERGHRCLIQVREEWGDERGLGCDVALVIRGLQRHRPDPRQLNVLWVISHPDDLDAGECEGYDLVCVASEPFAAALRGRVSPPVIALEQATDPDLFYPDPSPAYEHELLYVANSRLVRRAIVRDLLPTDRDLAIYGAEWEGLVDMSHVVAEHIPNDELRKAYSSAKVVLCDHWDDMRENGFVSNRIYDALACGATVVCDDVQGLAGRFGGAVRTYSGREQLRAVIEECLAAPPDGQPALPPGNTFGDRCDALLSHLPRRRRRLRDRLLPQRG